MTAQVIINRDTKTATETLGYLSFAGRKWPSIERAWVPDPRTPAGLKGVSCVPLGEYRLIPHSSEGHPRVWALVNGALEIYHWDWDVPKDRVGIARTVCLIHVANWASELEGCVAIGKQRIRDSSGHWMVTDSRNAINELRSCIGSLIDLRLTIQETSNG